MANSLWVFSENPKRAFFRSQSLNVSTRSLILVVCMPELGRPRFGALPFIQATLYVCEIRVFIKNISRTQSIKIPSFQNYKKWIISEKDWAITSRINLKMIMRPQKWPQATNTSAHWIVVDHHSLSIFLQNFDHLSSLSSLCLLSVFSISCCFAFRSNSIFLISSSFSFSYIFLSYFLESSSIADNLDAFFFLAFCLSAWNDS